MLQRHDWRSRQAEYTKFNISAANIWGMTSKIFLLCNIDQLSKTASKKVQLSKKVKAKIRKLDWTILTKWSSSIAFNKLEHVGNTLRFPI